MAKPSSGHTSIYKTDKASIPTDGRLFSPVFERNSPPMIANLASVFARRTGTVLEIGSGTGQHAGAFQLAFPQLNWQPSDPVETHRGSIAAWRRHLRLPGCPALDLDAGADWSETQEISDLGPLDAVISMNVIHIAPVEVAHGIIKGAANRLNDDGVLILYGPFRENGAFNSEGDAQFDANLRAEDERRGIRDIADLTIWTADVGLSIHDTIKMPANNRILIFNRP